MTGLAQELSRTRLTMSDITQFHVDEALVEIQVYQKPLGLAVCVHVNSEDTRTGGVPYTIHQRAAQNEAHAEKIVKDYQARLPSGIQVEWYL